ncbi:MAG: DUF4982 domain-containing protein [Bacteroidaceae bacterium]|nr:DUF4982 domain-containing protein [Bacteroidaceae bacterium]MBQ9642351.1 DUF4982 domain-containing protein [Bacteroidaceae bacterium]
MKKTIITFSFATLMALPLMAQYEERKEDKRQENTPLSEFRDEQSQLFNFGWKFQLGKAEGAEKPNFDDSQWRSIDLPHDFQFEMPWVEGDPANKNYKGRGFKEMGEGWYRKTFRVPAKLRGKRVTLDFGGIIFVGDVYVNGKKVASTDYGYVGFEADISKELKYDADNVVAVWASTGPANGSRWYTGGGIFRDVYLKVSNQTRIGRHGLYVKSAPHSTGMELPTQINQQLLKTNALNPQNSANPNQPWDVMVQLQLLNWQKHDLTIHATLKDADGKVVGQTSCGMPDHTNLRTIEVAMPFITVAQPHLWDIDTPYLYTVEATVKEGGVTIDSVSDQIGLRTIEYSPKFGFKLNGRKTFLTGIANHHDMGALGAAAFDKGVERIMRQLKAFGYNAIRCSHNPYSEAFCKIADRVGLLVVDELIDKWSDREYWGGRRPFMQIWPELIPEWVTRDRNRPSVILWSLGNELQTNDGWSGYKTNDWGITTYRIFDQMLKRFDQQRPTTVAMFPARAGAQRNTPDFKTYLVAPELGQATEVNSFNYQWDAYPGYFKQNPNLILFQSEAVSNQLQQPYYGMDRQRTVGLAWWGAIEYWGESNGWPKKGWNFAFFDHTLMPKPQAYLIKSVIAPTEPVCKIGVVSGKGEQLNWNDIKVGSQVINTNWNCTEGTKQNVFVYTNAEEVELIYNGKSLGTQRNDTTDIAKRNITYFAGIDYGKGGQLIAIARTGGKEVARDELQSTGKAVALRIIAEGKTPEDTFNPKADHWTADGMDLQYFKIYAVDNKGRIVTDATNEVTVSVTGEASLMAIDNGDHYTNDLFRPEDNTKQMQNGYMQAILRSTQKAGKTTLTVTSPTLKGAKITISSTL